MSFFDNVKTITFAEKVVKKLEIDGKMVWEAATYKNWARYSTEADGVTIYNNGLGYKNETRIRSGGAEAVQGNSSCTGFIPVKPLSVVRVSGCLASTTTTTAINVSNSTFTNLGQMVGNVGDGYGIMQEAANRPYNIGSVIQKDNYWEWIVPPDDRIAYIRVTGETSDGSKLIVAIDEEIT